MTAGGTSRAADAVALALAFHRAPVRHPDLLHARTPLPAGVDVLLKLAGGSRPGLETAALASPDELRAAALFFVEQVLLHHDASHYRVLGLEPGATAERIKEHHRLLMRLFHPDRERHDGDWKDAFATRINLAYTTLHEPDARRRYEAGLKAAPAATRRAAVRARPVRRRGLPPWLARHLPQWVLAGSALLALAVVGAVYVNNPRPAARLAATPLPADPLPAAEPPRPADAPQLAIAAPAEPAAAMAAANPVVAAAPLAPPPAVAAREPDRVPPATAAPAPAAPPPPMPAEKTAALSPPPPAPAARPEAPVVAPKPPAASAPAPAPAPAKPDPNATLARFASTYERGDTSGLMALFDEVAIGNAGGKPQIRRAHETLFRSTDLRRIDFENMAWSQEGDWLHGRGRYQATRMRKGELALETESGVVRIDLLRRGEHALIMALDYQPGERS